MAWRYPMFAEPSGAYLGEIELTGVEVTRTLSGPGRLTGTVLPGQDATLLRPWHVSIWAEDESGTIRGGGILTPADWGADAAEVDCVGRAGYPQGMPWTGDPYAGVQVDPLDVVRRIWAHLQAQPGGNIGVDVDATTSPVRVGTPESFTDAAGKQVNPRPWLITYTGDDGKQTQAWWVDGNGRRIDPTAWLSTYTDDDGKKQGAWFVNPAGERAAVPVVWAINHGDPWTGAAYWVDEDGKTQPAPDFWVDGDGDRQPAPADPTTRPKWKRHTHHDQPITYYKNPAGQLVTVVPDYWVDKDGKVVPAPADPKNPPSGYRHYHAGSLPPDWSRGYTTAGPPPGWVHYTPAAPDFWVDIDGERIATPPGSPPAGAKHYTATNPPPGWTKHGPANLPKGWKRYTLTSLPEGWKRYTVTSLPEGWTRTEAEPIALNWWSTADLGRVIDDLASAAPFDYLEHTAWAPDGSRLAHRLQLGHPTIGRRRADLRFALGENLALTPTLTGEDDGYASEVHALGAGEGAKMVRAPRITRDTTGVRRVLVHVDKTATTTDALAASARRVLAPLTGVGTVTQVVVVEHPHAPLGSFDVGDEIFLSGSDGLVALDRWVRIVEFTMRPEDTAAMTLSVVEV